MKLAAAGLGRGWELGIMLIGRPPGNSSLGSQATHTHVNVRSITVGIDSSDALQVYRCAGTLECVLAIIEAVINRRKRGLEAVGCGRRRKLIPVRGRFNRPFGV